MEFKFLALLLFSCSLFGCATSPYQSFKTEKTSNLKEIYKNVVYRKGPERNPVIVIPGFLGSRLIEAGTGKMVWGDFNVTPLRTIAEKSGELLMPLNPVEDEGARLLSLSMDPNKKINELKDTVVPDGVLDTVAVNFAGISVHLGAFSYIIEGLEAGHYKFESEGSKGKENPDNEGEYYTGFQFAYDWRQDLVQTAKELHDFIQEKRAYLQKEYEKRYGIKNYDVKFDIVAFSMAGLISRYYLRYGDANLPEEGVEPEVTWKGSQHVNKLIIVGTPNAGMLDAFTELLEGIRFVPILPKFKYEPAVLGTWPSYYQMLPPTENDSIVDENNIDGPGVDIFDPDLWNKMKWGLMNPKQDRILKQLLPGVDSKEKRKEIAADHLSKSLKRAKQFIKVMQIKPKNPPKSTTLHLFAGDAIPTKSKVAVNLKNGKVKVVETAPGDGASLRSSSLYDQRKPNDGSLRLKSPIYWTSATFLMGAHMAITKDPVFTDNALFLLLEKE